MCNELKYYKYSIARLSFVTNYNAQEIPIFDSMNGNMLPEIKPNFKLGEC